MQLSLNKRLREAVDTILNEESEFYLLAQSIKELEEIFSGLSPVKGAAGKAQVTGGTRLENGMAIAPDYAATVLSDIMRTVKFLRGVNAAIACALNRFKDRPVHILYAGCGPYATIVLPLLQNYKSEEIKVTFIDIHQICLDSAETILNNLNLMDYVAGIYCRDACTYTHPKDDPIHIVVSETMSQELRGEPQVSVTMNLAPQMVEGGLLVPEEVCISLQAVDSGREHKRKMGTLSDDERDLVRLHLGKIFVLDKKCSQKEIQKNAGDNISYIPAALISIHDRPEEYNQLMLFTDIRVFGNATLKPFESSLTGPLNLKTKKKVTIGQTLIFKYKLDNNPGLIVE